MAYLTSSAKRWSIPVVLGALVFGAAACSSSPSSNTPAAGHGSPAAAVVGFLQGLANNNVASACSYAAPNEQSQCNAGFAKGVSVTQSGFGTGNTFTDGNQALVVLVASSYCIGAGSAPTTTTCFSNSDPNKDLPSSAAGFQSALNVAFGSSVSPLAAAVQVNGQWYAEFAAGGGGAGTTGATGVTGPAGNTGGTTTSVAGSTGGTGA
jgi:hypothetical protein